MRHVYTSHKWSIIPFASFRASFFFFFFSSFCYNARHHDAIWVFLITVLAVTARLSDFLQQKCVAPLARVIPHSRPPVVHMIGGGENNRLHNGKPELMSSIVSPCCGCFLGAITFCGRYGAETPSDGIQSSQLWCCAKRSCVCVRAEFQVCLALRRILQHMTVP